MCSKEEQCINSACTMIDQCQIICESDKDCLRGELCVNPGDCKRSYCQPANSIVAPQEVVNRITQEIMSSTSFVIDKDGDPKWLPPRFEDVSEEDVAAIFAPLADDDEWQPLGRK